MAAEPINPSQTSVQALAYLGDVVLELLVREHLVRQQHRNAGELNHAAQRFVTARAQSAALERILPELTEEETDLYKRGRNAHNLSVPKSATTAEYRRATGLECLIGGLYLAGKMERVRTLFTIGYGDGGIEAASSAEG